MYITAENLHEVYNKEVISELEGVLESLTDLDFALENKVTRWYNKRTLNSQTKNSTKWKEINDKIQAKNIARMKKKYSAFADDLDDIIKEDNTSGRWWLTELTMLQGVIKVYKADISKAVKRGDTTKVQRLCDEAINYIADYRDAVMEVSADEIDNYSGEHEMRANAVSAALYGQMSMASGVGGTGAGLAALTPLTGEAAKGITKQSIIDLCNRAISSFERVRDGE